MIGPARIRLALVVGLAAAGGCDGCGRSGALVPFKADAGQGNVAPATTADPSAAAEATPFAPRDGHAFEHGTRRVAIEGVPFAVAAGTVRALLPEDLTGDGGRDALVVVASDAGGATLRFAARRGAGFAAPATLGSLFDDREGCTVDRAALRWLTPASAVATATRSCAAPTPGGPGVDDGVDDGAARERVVALIAIGEGQPRLGDVLRIAAPRGASDGDTLELEVDAADVDDDGRPDVVVRARGHVTGVDGPVEIALPWFDRAGGLSRDAAEPEAAMAAMAEDARKGLRATAERGAERARAVLGAWSLLCRESGEAQVGIGGQAGLPCGRSAAAARAASVLAAARAAQGDVFGALELARALEGPAWATADRDRALVRAALGDMPAVTDDRLRPGPTLPTLARPGVHRSRLAFLDEDRILVRGETARVLDFDRGTFVDSTPALDARVASPLVTDAAGRFVVTALERRCDGQTLELLAADGVVAGVVVGRPVGHPLLAARPPAPGCPTDRLPDPVREDADGWTVLGWPPQGVLAAKADRLRVVPLDTTGRPAGEPLDVPPGTPPPAPLVPGAVTADGRLYALGTRWGVVVRRVAPNPGVTVHRPAGWDPGDPPPGDLAVSPSGQRLAWVRGGRVELLGAPSEAAEADAPPAAIENGPGPD